MPTKKAQTAESKPSKRTASPKERTASPKKTSQKGTPAPAAKGASGDPQPATKKKRVSKPSSGSDSSGAENGSKTPRATKADTIAASTSEIHPAHIPVVTAEHIAVRAYFLAENRHAAGIPGDHASDWHEAEAQLQAEAASIAASLKYQ